MSSSLLGRNRVSEQEIAQVPAIPFTKSFSPVHHIDVIRVLKNALYAVGLDIVKAEYVLAAEGMKMFGVYDLSQGNSELCWSIGIRNSMNKTMALGITAGTRVFVCENLCFSGEYLSLRRHTSGLDMDELSMLAYRSMQTMTHRLAAFEAWHTGLKSYPLSETDMMVLMVEILDNQVVPASKFHQLRGLCSNVYDENTLWSLHEAATDILKVSNLLTLPKKNMLLNKVMDNYIYSLESAGSSSLGDFYQNRALIHS